MFTLFPPTSNGATLVPGIAHGENMEKDYFQNAVVGKNVMVFDTKSSMVHVPDNKLVVLQGLEDFIVVDTKDVLLISKKHKEQEIKDYVAEIKRNKGEKYL